MKKCIYILFVFVSVSMVVYSQNNPNDSQLALQYYQDKEYDKALEIYKKLYNNSHSNVFFRYYIRCLTELEDYNSAEKVIKKQIKRFPHDLSYLVEMGYLYKIRNITDKSVEYYDKAIKKLEPDQNQIIRLANSFVTKREFEYAEKVYKQGRKILKGDYTFNIELAVIYQYQRDYSRMIDEYLNLLLIDDSYIQNVQNRLQNAVYSDIDNKLTELLKENLIARIQKHAGRTVLSELLIWVYIQEKNFDSALVQAKSLDKRLDEDGVRLIALGDLAVSNNNYNVAIDAYKYVIEKGIGSGYYIEAKNKFLNTLYNKIISRAGYSRKELLELEHSYIETLDELGENNNTVQLSRDLAHIQAFYLGKEDESILRLRRTLDIGGLNGRQIAECKLELADVLLFAGDPYESTLYYAQVERANTNNPLGHEAKFRKARLAYFTGDFRWAQAQLDVLKASTSKLIANDAFDLSLLINDNSALDTSEAALRLFAKADLLIYQNKDSLAFITFDSITDMLPYHSLFDEILFRKASIKLRRGDYSSAVAYLEEIVKDYSWDILADDALFMLAEIYETEYKDIEKAKELYRQILENYSGSIYVVEARKRYRRLRGDLID